MAAKIRANRRKLRDELIIHRQKLLFFNKKIVLPTPICKFNQLIRIDEKKASRLHCGLLFHSYANRLCCLFYWVMFFLVFDDVFRYQMDNFD